MQQQLDMPRGTRLQPAWRCGGDAQRRCPRAFASARQQRRRCACRVAARADGNEPGPSRRDLLTLPAGVAAAQLLGSPAAKGAQALQATPVESIETVQLGRTGLEVSSGGIGAWSWGDRSGYWGYNGDYGRSDNEDAFRAIVDSRIGLVDTAEVYGFGLSEEILGAAMRDAGRAPFVATKFAPLPWRFTSGSVVKALQGSLDRLGLAEVGLYQLHWPGFLTQGWSNDAFVRGLAQCRARGLAQAVGVSNFRADRVRRAASILEGEGQQLASNQVQYSLLYRVPEQNGVAAALQECGATLIAYSPLCQGLLTGKYTESNLPSGPRAAVINKDRVREVQPLLAVMREISASRDKTLAQIAINWTLCKGALPIPGAKNPKQVREAAGAFGWRLSSEEVAALDLESGKLKPSLANPVENF